MTTGTFPERLREVASAHPSDVAIEDGAFTVTYGDFDSACDRLALRLVGLGVRPRDRVALISDNSAAFLAASCAVWRAGAVLTTMYPSGSSAELGYAIDSSGASLVLTDTRSASRVEALSPAAVAVIDNSSVYCQEEVPGDPLTLEQTAPTSSDLALICFTSGSTSKPKAVMHSHGGLQAAAEAYADVWRLTAEDRTVVCLPMAWVYGLTTTSMMTLSRGGTVISLPRAEPVSILDAVGSGGATFLPGVTTMFTKLVQHLAERPPLTRSALRLCVSGGEPRNEVAFSRWREFTGVPVHDVFAASECFPVITYDPVIDPDPAPGSAGKLVAGAEMKVLGVDGEPVQQGEVGEAYWRGPALFLGYWGDEELTRRALTPDGWYRTRDLVRIDAAGYVTVMGRLSDMIIRGGSNVSPAEVESVLATHPSVRSAVVVGVPDEVYGERVVAAVVLRQGAPLEPEDLDAWCRSRLAEYKIPSEFVPMEEFPVNPRTGKTNRSQIAVTLAGSDR